MSSRVQKKSTAREKAAAALAEQQRSERRRRMAFAGAAVVLVVVLVVALVVAKLSGAGGGGTTKASGRASAALLKSLSSVPSSTFDSVGTGTAKGGPSPIKAPALTADGKPRVLYVGAEYCPYCAAERWAVAIALDRFGSFSSLGTTHSSADDVYPNTPTLSFHKASYSSDTVSFTGVETTTSDKQPLDTPTDADQKIFDTYDKAPYVKGQAGSIPFVAIAGKYVSSGSTYDPQLLAGKTQQQVADALKDPSSAISKAIIGSANVFTAAICASTGDKPSDVYTSSGVTTAAASLGKG